MPGSALPVPAFDDVSAWGRYRPTRTVALRLDIAHRLPRSLRPLVRLLRRPVKYRLATPIDLEIWDLKLRLMPRGNLSELKLLSAPHLFDPEELGVLSRVLRPGTVMVDVGANAGVYSFWADRCMQGQGRIIAVEPDPEMRRRMQFNIATNGLSTIEIAAVALSDREGSAVLHVDPRQRGLNTLLDAEGHREDLSVPVLTLGGLLARCGVEHVDLMKLDIEGHEPAVLRHFLGEAPDGLMPGAVICEHKPATRGEIVALLHGRGYRVQAESGLNLVFARS